MLTSGNPSDGMATKPGVADMAEACSTCGRDTPHDVSVHILTESTAEENAEFSREPYRVSTCQVCGATTKTRMNNA
jgi:rRNA maturation protein Nop10